MPLYEFQCQDCQTVIEVLMKMSDPAPQACTACNEGSLKKILSRNTYTHSGQGWYKKSFVQKGKKLRHKGTRGPERAPITIDDAHYHPENASTRMGKPDARP